MAKHDTRDVNDLLKNLDPSLKDKVLKEDVAKAQKVRETFLSYRKQLVASMKVLDKHSADNDQKAKEMAEEVQGLIMVLDKLEKRKRVTADTLLDFMSQMRSIGGKLNATADDKGNKSALAEELRRQKQATLDDDKKQDSRFESLAKSIGQPLDKFIKSNADAIGAGGGSALKLALGAWLGPAAPLVKLVDDLVDIEGKVGKAYTATVELTKKTLKATVSAPAKMIKSGGEWAKANIDYLKNRARDEDSRGTRSDRKQQALLKEQLSNMKDMRKKLGRLGGIVGGALSTVVTGLGLLLSKAISSIGSILSRVLAGVMGGRAGQAAKGVYDTLKGGAKRIFGKKGPKGPGGKSAGKNAGSFMEKAVGKGMGNTLGNVAKVGGKMLGGVGGAYGMYDGYNTVRDNKDKGFFESGEGGMMDSRAGGYASATLGGAAVGATVGSIVPVIGTAVGAAVGAVVGGLTAVVADNEEAIVGALKAAGNKATQFGSKMLDKAKGAIKEFGPLMATGPFGLALSGLSMALGINSDDLKKWAGSVGDWLSDTATTISTSVSDALTKVGDIVGDAWKKVSGVVEGVVGKIGDAVSGAFGKLGEWLSAAGLGKAVDWAKEKAQVVSDTYQDTKKAAGDAVTKAWSSVSGWFDDAKNSVSGLASSTATQATAAVLNAATSVKNSVQSGTGVNVASALPDTMRKNIVQTKAGANYEAVKGHIQDASKQTGVNAGTMARFAQIESGFNPNAKAGTSSAGGLYQFVDGTWDEMLKKHGKKYGLDANASKFDPKANALMGAEFLKGNKEKLAKVTGGEVNDTQLYMAHFLGAGGATEFFKAMQKNPDAPAATAMPKAAKANASIFYDGGRARSFKEVYALMANKVAKTDNIAAAANAEAGTPQGVAGSGGTTAPTAVASSATPVAQPEAHYIPKSTIPPTVNADTGTTSVAQSSGPATSGGMKSSLSQVPFCPDDQNLLAFNLVGVIG